MAEPSSSADRLGKFVNWFQDPKNGGWIDQEKVGLRDFSEVTLLVNQRSNTSGWVGGGGVGMGVGAVALEDIEADAVLFSIPNRLLLSSHHSALRSLLPESTWSFIECRTDSLEAINANDNGGADGISTAAGEGSGSTGQGCSRSVTDEENGEGEGTRTSINEHVDDGEEQEAQEEEEEEEEEEMAGNEWPSLILTMMWEDARSSSPSSSSNRDGGQDWRPFFDILPRKFDTPMFWPEEDLARLKGTDVYDKIGKEQAEELYKTKILPVIQRYPSVFHLPSNVDPISGIGAFTLSDFHIQGSRILSRSFTVDRARARSSGLDPIPANEGDSEDEDEDDSVEVMVPMADMLNAGFGKTNARLFHDTDCVKMVADRKILKGEQILNTYNHPSNADLLRKYGHVDTDPLLPNLTVQEEPLNKWPKGNLVESVDISGKLICEVIIAQRVKQGRSRQALDAMTDERVDWWLDNGGDDVFTLHSEALILAEDWPKGSERPQEPFFPPSLTSFVRVLLLDSDGWKRATKSDKIPKPRPEDSDEVKKIADVIREALELRYAEHGGSVKDDISALLAHEEGCSTLALNAYQALVVRVSEARVLALAKNQLDEMCASWNEKLKAQEKESKNLKRKQTRTARDMNQGKKRR